MRRRILSAASALVLLAASALGGCGGGSTPAPANVVGQWFGDLALNLLGIGNTEGFLTLKLEQADGTVGGAADWEPIGAAASITGSVTDTDFEFRLFTRCPKGSEETVLRGTIAARAMSVTGADGKLCIQRETYTVLGGEGLLEHEANALPL